MACFSRELISNIHEILDPLGRKLDCVLMSHTHYDHIGALPYILKEWPDAVVHGAKKAIQVFSSEEASRFINFLRKGEGWIGSFIPAGVSSMTFSYGIFIVFIFIRYNLKSDYNIKVGLTDMHYSASIRPLSPSSRKISL